jgi:spore photoproduct lyase
MQIYIEKELKQSNFIKNIYKKFPEARFCFIDDYRDIFYKSKQNCFLQKKEPKTLIFAKNKNKFLNINPDYCATDQELSYYFSLIYNCPFNCEYCFLPAMMSCSYPVIFVNFNDLFLEIKKILKTTKKPIRFFANYHNDAFIYEEFSNMCNHLIPEFSKYKNALLELRTKSANYHFLKKLKPEKNILITYTINPEIIQKKYEKNTASFLKRLKALKEISAWGFKIGIRIEPVLKIDNFEKIYQDFFNTLEKNLKNTQIENIFYGPLKIPQGILENFRKNDPENFIFKSPLTLNNKIYTYPENTLKKQNEFLTKNLKKIFKKTPLYTNY